jgi:hypothetical protein
MSTTAEALFDVLDEDGDGFVTEADLQRAMLDQQDPATISSMFASLDVHGEGRLSRHSFAQIWANEPETEPLGGAPGASWQRPDCVPQLNLPTSLSVHSHIFASPCISTDQSSASELDDSVSIDASPLFVLDTSPCAKDRKKRTKAMLLSVSPSVAAASSRSKTTVYSASPIDHMNIPLSPATFLSARAMMEQVTSPVAQSEGSQQARLEKRLLFYREELNRMGTEGMVEDRN